MRCYAAAFLLVFAIPQNSFANNVRVFVSSGNLYIYGDSKDNSIAITSPMQGQIQVAGKSNSANDPTVVNGQSNDTAVFDQWYGGIYVYLYDGSDEVIIHDAVVAGVAHFDLGPGNDSFYAGQTLMAVANTLLSNETAIVQSGNVDFRSILYVIGANGNDYAEVTGVDIKGRATFTMGNGNDVIMMGDQGGGDADEFSVNIFNTLAILPGGDTDQVGLNGVNVLTDLLVDDAAGGLALAIENSESGRNLLVYGTSLVDDLYINQVSVDGLLGVISEGSDDSVFVSGTFGQLVVDSGAGDDFVELNRCSTGLLRAYLGGGNDDLRVSECDSTDIYGYGGAGNDAFSYEFNMADRLFVYGDGGTDSLNLTANMFGSAKTYSVENK